MAAVAEREQQLVLDLPLPVAEARLVQHADRRADYRWKGYITVHHRETPESRMHQRSYPAERMAWAIDQYLKSKGKTHDLYISQHTYQSRTRSTDELLSLNLGHIDLDTYNCEWAAVDKPKVVSAVLQRLLQHNIPLPSYIVDTGRGIQLKWIFTEPLSPKARTRWQAVLRYLNKEVFHDFAADDKAILPTQISRIIGSTNLKKEYSIVDICWVNGSLLGPAKVDFNEWAKAILPYTREEVQAFYAKMHLYDRWRAENKANMALLLAEQPNRDNAKQRKEAWKQVGKAIGLDIDPAALESIDDLVAGEIWERRLKVMDRLIEVRKYEAGIPKGERFQWTWIAANAYAWVNRSKTDSLRTDIISWCKKRIPAYTAQEAYSAAASVMRRSKEEYGQGTGLYKMKETTFLGPKLLNVTPAEREALAIQASRAQQEQAQLAQWNIGSMKFEKMKGLSFDEYKAEKRSRQSQSAERTNDMNRKANAPMIEKAKELRAANPKMSVRTLAAKLGVGKSTADRWLKQ